MSFLLLRSPAFLLLALLLTHAVYSQLPPEWQHAVEDCDVLFSPDDSLAAVTANIQATIGNGFLATQMRRYRRVLNLLSPPSAQLKPSAAPLYLLLECSTAPPLLTPAIALISPLPSTSTSNHLTPTTESMSSLLVYMPHPPCCTSLLTSCQHRSISARRILRATHARNVRFVPGMPRSGG